MLHEPLEKERERERERERYRQRQRRKENGRIVQVKDVFTCMARSTTLCAIKGATTLIIAISLRDN